MDSATRQQLREILYQVAGDEAGLQTDTFLERIYNMLDQKLRNELVSDLRNMGSCPICGAPYHERRHH